MPMKRQIAWELLCYLRDQKKWWLGTVVVLLLLLSMILVFTQGSALAPFIYALF